MASAPPDLTYACHDGMWTRFYPETPAGEAAYSEMASADPEGVVAFLAPAMPGVLVQLRKAGLTVRKARSAKPMTAAELDAALADLDAMLGPEPMADRFYSAGLAHSAADEATARTGVPHVMAFRPRSNAGQRPGDRDPKPFVVVQEGRVDA